MKAKQKKKKKVFQEKKERKTGTALACIFAIAVSRHWRVKADTCKLDKLSLSPTLLLKPQITQTSYPFLFYFLSLKIKKKEREYILDILEVLPCLVQEVNGFC
jgi:hypothetical protein